MPLREPQTRDVRTLIEDFNSEFVGLYSVWCSLIRTCRSEYIYGQPAGLAPGLILPSVGESVLRSAATVEQTCGGLTSSLWDDPFEWTLPETLTTQGRILEYLDEVETTRNRAFGSFLSDADLLKGIVVPSGEVQTIATLLLATLSRACQYQGQAALTAKILSAQNTSGFII